MIDQYVIKILTIIHLPAAKIIKNYLYKHNYMRVFSSFCCAEIDICDEYSFQKNTNI